MCVLRVTGFMCALALMVAAFALSLAPSAAWAADFEGCCGDLESRVAELEATTARKGNRNVSLQIYGQVNRALMIWDDGIASDAYVVDNDSSSTRLGLIGEAKMKPGWFAGYRIEIEFKDSASDEVSNGPEADEGRLPEVRLRQSYWYIDNEKLGRISVGQQSPATDDITIINLGAKMSDAALHYSNSFGLRLDVASGLMTDLHWAHLAHNVDSLRGDFVRYDSPALRGFVLSAAVGEDDVWDVALRYQGEWNSIRLATGVGYMDAQELDLEDVRGSASVMHMPTGLYLSAAGGLRDDQSRVLGDGDGSHFYFGQLGIRRQVLPFGDTTLYGEFGNYQDYTVGRLLQADIGSGGQFTNWGQITDTAVQRWGVGIEQTLDKAATVLYAQYHHYQADISGMPCLNGGCTDFGSVESLPVEPWTSVVLGARVQF
jgi:hypothetical protein